MTTKCAELARLDALWRAYVEADPDLRRMEHRKQAIAHRRIRQAHAKRARAEAGRAIVHSLVDFALKVAICTATVVVFLWLVVLA